MYTYNYCFRYWKKKKKEKQTFTHLGKTPFLSLFQYQLHSSSVLLLHFTLSPLCEAKKVQGCCDSSPCTFCLLSSSSPLLLPWCSLCCFLLLPPALTLSSCLWVLVFSPLLSYIPRGATFFDDRLSCVLWLIHLSQLEAALSQVRLPCASSHKSQPCSPPAASTLKSEQNALPYSAKWEICCKVCFGLFEEWDCLFSEGQLCWIGQSENNLLWFIFKKNQD